MATPLVGPAKFYAGTRSPFNRGQLGEWIAIRINVNDLLLERDRIFATMSQDLIGSASHPEVNAVAIVTPVYILYFLVQKAVHAGKHVLITKPLTNEFCFEQVVTESCC